MTFAILFVSIVILACLVGNRISNRIGVPMLLIFIVLGMFFGSDGVIRISLWRSLRLLRRRGILR